MLRYIVRPQLRNFTVIVRRNSYTPEKRRLYDLVDELIKTGRAQMNNLPMTKEDALSAMTRDFLAKDLTMANAIRAKRKDEFLDIYEKDDLQMLGVVSDHLRSQCISENDQRIRNARARMKRMVPPIRNYAIFLKYLYEEKPDLALISKFYERIPSPRPLYIKPSHHDKLIAALEARDSHHLLIAVMSDLKDANMDMTTDEKALMIRNLFSVGHSSPATIYDFLQSNFHLDNIKLYNTIFESCLRHHDEDLFFRIYNDMTKAQILPDSNTIPLLFRTTNQQTFTNHLEQFLSGSINGYLSPEAFNCLLASCLRFEAYESAYSLFQWLTNMNDSKTLKDSYQESKAFWKKESALFDLLRRKRNDKGLLAYYLNFDEQTADIMLQECLRRSKSEKNIDEAFDLLKIADESGVILWESSYKNLFQELHNFDQSHYTLNDLRKLVSHFFDKHREELPMILSNKKFRNLLLSLFRNVYHNTGKIDKLGTTFEDMFDSFYVDYPRGLRSAQEGSSRYHQVMMRSIIDELQKLLKENE